MTSWAFVVGINQYRPESKLPPLAGAVADAAEFAEWALHPEGGGVAPEHLFLWTCPAPPPAASRPLLNAFVANPTTWLQTPPDFGRAPGMQEICLGLSLVAEKALQDGAQRLYVYFAGHGFQTRQRSYEEPAQTCFVAGDYDPRIAAAGLVPCDDMARMLKVVGPPEIVIFVDACRSEASPRVAKPPSPWNIYPDRGQNLRLCTARAAQEQMVAYEVPHDNPTRGAFSLLLVNGLATFRPNGRLTLRDLETFIAEGIGDLVKPRDQYPDFDERPKPWRLVLTEGASIYPPAEVVITVANTFANGLSLIGGPDQERRSIPGAAGTHRLSAHPGNYVIETPEGQELVTFSHLGPGDTDVAL